MANVLTSRPIVIDTTMTNPANLGRPIFVDTVVWYKPADAAATDNFVIADGSTAANVLLQGVNSAANLSQVFNFHSAQLWKNFKVTFTGTNPGVLYIYPARG